MYNAQPFNFTGAIVLQLLLSFYYIYFIIRPLSEIEKITGKVNYGYRFFIFRIICLLAIDLFAPSLASMIDISLLFVLSFFTMPNIKKEMTYVASIDSMLSKYNELTDEELTSFGIEDRSALEKQLFNVLSKVQTARSDYDYDTLKKLCTEHLYNLYISELETLEKSNFGYHFEDYHFIQAQIYEIKSDSKKITLKVALKARCIDYRLSEDKELVDGSNIYPTIIIHELEFIKKIAVDELEKNCPNCGAPTKRNVKNKCSYCGTIIDGESTDWILSKNKILLEKVVKK